MAFRWCCMGFIVVLGCGTDPSSGSDSSSTGATGTTDTSSSSSGTESSTGASTTSSTSTGTTTGGSTSSSTSDAGDSESSSGSQSESSSGGQHVCPGTGYCESKPDANVIISDNHRLEHTISILNEHIYACEEHEYDIQGAADHSHIVTLSPSHYGTIDDSGMQITVTSTEVNGHTHDVWSDCE